MNAEAVLLQAAALLPDVRDGVHVARARVRQLAKNSTAGGTR